MTSSGNSEAERLLAAIAAIKPWKRGGQRAPHKPLLLLLALGRIQHGEPRDVLYADIDAPLRKLLEDFGPSRQAHHPEYPFWYLQNDRVWQVAEAASFQLKQGGRSPAKSTLIKGRASGGLPPDFDQRLRSDPDLLSRAAQLLLDEHFPASYHAALLAEVGLDLDVDLGVERETVTRKKRDPRFPRLVLRAYEYRCAICGLDMQLDGRSVGLEAAHVKWHTHNGPSDVANGLALCPLHHRALDLGVWGLTDERQVIVSRRLHGGPAVEEAIVRHHGTQLRAPQAGEPEVAKENAQWHRSEVFRDPPRAIEVA